MSTLSPGSAPQREVIAPRHESLTKEFRINREERKPGWGEARLWIVARDAHWLFAYWELEPAEHPGACDDHGRSHFYLRVYGEDGAVTGTVKILPAAGHWYLSVPNADAAYYAELGFFQQCGAWAFVAQSGTTRTPPLSCDPACGSGDEAERMMADLRTQPKWTDAHEQVLAQLLEAESASAAAERVRAVLRR